MTCPKSQPRCHDSFFFNCSVVDLKCCVHFCCTEKWFSYLYIHSFSIHTHTHSYVVVQLLSQVQLCVTPCTAVCQASLSFTLSRSCSNSCQLSWWCHPTFSSSVAPFSSCPPSFPALGSFQMSRLFASGGQSIGASTSHSYTCIHSLYIHKRSQLVCLHRSHPEKPWAWFSDTVIAENVSAFPIEECSLGQISHFWRPMIPFFNLHLLLKVASTCIQVTASQLLVTLQYFLRWNTFSQVKLFERMCLESLAEVCLCGSISGTGQELPGWFVQRGHLEFWELLWAELCPSHSRVEALKFRLSEGDCSETESWQR